MGTVGTGWLVTETRRLDSGVIAEARDIAAASLYEANEQRGALDPGIHQITPGLSLCGSALTVRCQPGDNLTLHAAVATASPGDVIVADVGDFSDAGHWGEILTVAAIARGVVGLVINGGVRDAAVLQPLGFPVFARGLSMKATTKQIRGLINHPTRCGGVDVEPGDLVVGDADGVVVIARERARNVIEKAKARERDEARMMEQLREGATTLDLLGISDRIEADIPLER